MLGHKSLRAVERYLHEMPGTTNRSALNANHRARTDWNHPTASPATHENGPEQPEVPALAR